MSGILGVYSYLLLKLIVRGLSHCTLRSCLALAESLPVALLLSGCLLEEWFCLHISSIRGVTILDLLWKVVCQFGFFLLLFGHFFPFFDVIKRVLAFFLTLHYFSLL